MHKAIGWSVMSLAFVSGTLLAQQQPVRPTQPGVQPGARPGAQPAQTGVQQNQQGQQQGDQQIATLIWACNRNEVETAKFAMNKLQSDQAKEIATQMIKDHTEAMNKFARWAGPGAQQNTGTSAGEDPRENQGDRREQSRDQNRREGNREEGRRDNERSEAQPATAPNNAGAAAQPATGGRVPAGTAPANTAQGTNQGNTQTVFRPVTGGLNWTAIHQEIANQSLAGTKEELSRYEGIEFDKAFLGHQLAAHLKAATELKVLKRHASSQLGSEIDNAIATTEEHIKHLRTAMEDKKDEKSNNKR